MNYYKIAPTWLHKDTEAGQISKLFTTQEAVTDAWKDGWYGPSGLVRNMPLLSTLEYESKSDIRRAVVGDPRYAGLTFGPKDTVEVMMNTIGVFEIEHNLTAEV